MVCSKCGYVLDAFEKECPRCIRTGSVTTVPPPPPGASAPSPQKAQRKPRAQDHPSYWAFSLLAFFIPLAGLILGCIKMSSPDLVERKLGSSTLQWALVGFLAGIAVVVIVIMAATQPTPPYQFEPVGR